MLKSIENGLAGYLGSRFLEMHGLKIGYEPAKPAGEKIAFALVQDQAAAWVPIDPSVDYRVAINSYNFKSGEGHDFSKAKDIQYCEVRLSSVFERYLAAKRQLTPQLPNRIVPLTAGLLSESNAGGQWVIHVKGVPPHCKLILGAGNGQGVESLDDGIPLPLSECKLVATGEADDGGAWDWKMSPGLSRWIAVAAIPAGNSTSALISYPVLLK